MDDAERDTSLIADEIYRIPRGKILTVNKHVAVEGVDTLLLLSYYASSNVVPFR